MESTHQLWIVSYSCFEASRREHILSDRKHSEREKVKVKWLSRVRLFVTRWTVAYQAPPSVGFPRQEYWSRLPFKELLNRGS